MKVAVIGGGGREHAITWKLSKSPKVDEIFVFTGNPGMKQLGTFSDIDPNDFEALSAFLKENKVDYTVVGPEDPLANGIVDHLEKEGIKAFGPNKEAALMEGSKAFAKKIMALGNVPTAAYREFEQAVAAVNYIKQQSNYPMVLKADGLCAGKGVLIAQSEKEALDFVEDTLNNKQFGESGSRIIIEEFLEGEEVSIFAITDGKSVKYLSPAQDHKQIYEGDKGPNTGGMGTYGPTALASEEFFEKVDNTVTQPTLAALKESGITYKGVLYIGLILTQDGPKVLEFNCRFGDPETQVLMPLLKSDLMDLVEGVCNENLEKVEVELSNDRAVCFVAASAGYPGSYPKGKEIHGLDKVHSQIFFAGVKEESGKYLTNGGRVLNVVALGSDIEKAREKALEDMQKVSFEGMQYRRDIAMKELSRPKIAVIMGSDSDLPVVKECLKILDQLGVPFQVSILSAHRSPEAVSRLAKSWEERGFKVVIAAAGMAAHLPGVVAAYTNLPVIGIPLEAKLQGIDALYSIVQMPGGVPVATVSMGKAGAKNAAILALEILSLSDSKIKKNLKKYKLQQKTAVLEKNKLVGEIGYEKYLERKNLD